MENIDLLKHFLVDERDKFKVKVSNTSTGKYFIFSLSEVNNMRYGPSSGKEFRFVSVVNDTVTSVHPDRWKYVCNLMQEDLSCHLTQRSAQNGLSEVSIEIEALRYIMDAVKNDLLFPPEISIEFMKKVPTGNT